MNVNSNRSKNDAPRVTSYKDNPYMVDEDDGNGGKVDHDNDDDGGGGAAVVVPVDHMLSHQDDVVVVATKPQRPRPTLKRVMFEESTESCTDRYDYDEQTNGHQHQQQQHQNTKERKNALKRMYSSRRILGSDLNGDGEEDEIDLINIPDDVYSMFFISKWNSPAFFYALYVYITKLCFYTLLVVEAVNVEVYYDRMKPTLFATQFLILPVAVAMQDDLIATFHIIANVKFSENALMKCYDASKLKFNLSCVMRGTDGMYSLLVNFVILLKATEVLELFLNFAALEFITSIDNIALKLAADGYLTDELEDVATAVQAIQLPKKKSKFMQALDSTLFLFTLGVLIIAWGIVVFL